MSISNKLSILAILVTIVGIIVSAMMNHTGKTIISGTRDINITYNMTEEKKENNSIIEIVSLNPVLSSDKNLLNKKNIILTKKEEKIEQKNVLVDQYLLEQCGAIKDVSTKLRWYIGPDINMTWHKSKQWISELSKCDGNWRMPSISEIKTLYDPSKIAGTGYFIRGKYFPAKIHPVFNGIGGGSWVWSAEVVNSKRAKSLNLNQGKTVIYEQSNINYSTRAFAVK